MAFVIKFIAAVALISSLFVSHYIPKSDAATLRAVTLSDKFEVVITTGKNHTGSVSGVSIQVQSEVAGTVLELDTNGSIIAANKISTFNVTSLGITGDICFVSLQYTGGSAASWSVDTIQVTNLANQKTALFEANSSVKKLTGALQVDNCKQRQES